MQRKAKMPDHEAEAPDLGPKLGRLLSWSGLSDVARSTRPREGRVH